MTAPAATASMRLPLAQAERLARKIRDELAPWCSQIEIAGSIRRRRPDCGDIDLVVLPGCAAHVGRITERCGRHAQLVKDGEQYKVYRLANGFQLDLWFAHDGEVTQEDLLERPRETAPGNFGVLLLARTGSARFNVWFAQECHRKGYHFNPHRGIQALPDKGSRVIAATEEMDLFEALGIHYIKPEDRER